MLVDDGASKPGNPVSVDCRPVAAGTHSLFHKEARAESDTAARLDAAFNIRQLTVLVIFSDRVGSQRPLVEAFKRSGRTHDTGSDAKAESARRLTRLKNEP